MDVKAQKVLQFWFGDLATEDTYPEVKAKKWFKEGASWDEEIRENFSDIYSKAIQEQLMHWKDSPEGCLALIIVLDQFSRNLFRNQAECYAQDEKSLVLTLEGIKNKWDEELKPVERVFFYMPLMHAENYNLQEKSVNLYTQLADTCPPAIEIPIRQTLEFAVKHKNIIEQFGRFPYRNEELDRESTDREIEFLNSASGGWY